jgi:G3E family GTPase
MALAANALTSGFLQLAAADLILLNKIDLVTTDVLAGRAAWLRAKYPDARVVPCRQGRLRWIYCSACTRRATTPSPLASR